jgi:hypothetical protein
MSSVTNDASFDEETSRSLACKPEHVSQRRPDNACGQFADSILDTILDAAPVFGGALKTHKNPPAMCRTQTRVPDRKKPVSAEVPQRRVE